MASRAASGESSHAGNANDAPRSKEQTPDTPLALIHPPTGVTVTTTSPYWFEPKFVIPLALLPSLVGIALAVLASKLASRSFERLSSSPPPLSYHAQCNLAQSWSWPDQLFDVTLAWGSLPFGTAKAVDVVFDAVAGRGLQGILAIISYRVLTAVMVKRLAQPEGVGIETYATTAFRPVSFQAMWVDVKDLVRSRKRGGGDWKQKLVLVGVVLAVFLVLIFSTLVGAMTGYIGRNDTLFYTTPPNATAPASQFLFGSTSGLAQSVEQLAPVDKLLDQPMVAGIGIRNIFNGSLIDNTSVASGYAGVFLSPTTAYPLNLTSGNWTETAGYETPLAGSIYNQILSFYNRSGAHGFSINSTVANFTAGALNLTVMVANGSNQTFHITSSNSSLSIHHSSFYHYRNLYIPPTILNSRIACFPIGSYSWGFSLLLTNITVALFLTWSIFMLVLYLWAISDDAAARASFGQFRAVLEMAAVMRDELGYRIGGAYGNRQIERDFAEHPGIRVQYVHDGAPSLLATQVQVDDSAREELLPRRTLTSRKTV